MAVLLLVCTPTAGAGVPPLADVDAHARASGNDPAIAVTVGKSIFATEWPLQVMQISANGIDDHVVLGLRLSGVKFHGEPAIDDFRSEVMALVERAFAAAPHAEEVDVWVTVPIHVGKDVVVSGDLAMPTTRTVFTLTVLRSESAASVKNRLAAGTNIFMDEEWARAAFKRAGT
jgi:hypothetical protein